MAEQGFILDIDTKFLQRLEQADKALGKMVSSVDRVSSQLNNLADGPLAKFASMIGSITGSVEKLSSTKVGDLGLKEAKTLAEGTVDAINAMTKSAASIKSTPTSMDTIDSRLASMYDRISRLKAEVDQFKEWEGGNLIGSEDYKYIAGVTDEINSLINAYTALDSARERLSRTPTSFQDAVSKLEGKDVGTMASKHELARMSEFYKEQDRLAKENDKAEEKRYQNALKRLAERTKEEEKELKEREAKRREIASRDAKEAIEAEEKRRRTLSGAMSYSSSARTITQQLQAIKYLESARDNLSRDSYESEEAYKEAVKSANSEINRQKESVKALRGEQESLSRAYDKLIGVMGAVFSINAIRGYINQVIKVRGEFELQQRALQALLKNKREANELWNQTVRLAVRSPFQVKELVTYTKQLAAYRVETEKLHDTTKMLADISAGLGVDMGRLILAFGQVKAANYLRGTELRQFSEAGINILDELARYYTAMEGRAVTVSQVFDRVSKRMVSFADVEKVLQNVTGAGGMFYKMQEIQAETLKGSISNLKDQIDLMLNEIGEKNEGVLKAGVRAAAFLVESYKLLLPVLSIVAVGFTAMSLSMLKVKVGLKALAVGAKSFKSAMLNPITLAIVAFTELASIVFNYVREVREISKEHKRLRDSLVEIGVAMNDAFNEKNIGGVRAELDKLLSTAKNDFGIDFGLSDEDIQKLSLDKLKDKFEELRGVLFDSNVIAESIIKANAKAKLTESTLSRGYMFAASLGTSGHGGESMDVDIKQYEKSAAKLLSTLQKAGFEWAVALNIPRDHPLRELQRGDETDLQYLYRLISGYEDLKAAAEMKGFDTSSADKALRRFRRKEVEAIKEAKRMFVDYTDDFEKAGESAAKGAINAFVTYKGWSMISRELAQNAMGYDLDIENDDTNKDDNKFREDAGKDPRWENLLRTIKEMNSAFKELNKTFDETTAKEGMMAKYSDALNDVLSKVTINGEKLDAMRFVEMFDVSNEEGMKAALDLIAKEAPDAADKLKAKLEKGEIIWDAKIRLEEIKHKELMGDMEDLFSGYELSLELEKMNIPPSFAKNFFNLEATSLDEVRSQIESRKGEFSGLNMEGEYKELLEKLSAMEAKEQQERLKKYLGYARDAIGERAKIKLEEMRKLQEIELAFAPKVGESAEDRTIRETAKASAIEGVRAESYQQTKKQEWEDFQKSDTFISIFQDLDMASETLINHALAKLQEFKDSWADMPHEEMRSIAEKMNQLTSKLATIENPFKAFKETRKALDGVGSIDELQMSNVEQEAKISEYQKELELSERILALHQEGKAIEADELALAENRLEYFDLSADEVADIVDAQKRGIKTAEDQIEKNNKGLSLYKKAKAQLLEQVEAVRKVQSVANDLYSAFKDLSEVLGDDDGTVALFMDIGNSIIDSVLNAISLKAELFLATLEADGFGAALNAAMGPIGWIVLSVQLISKILGAVFQAHDNRLEKQIERISERVEVLQEQFEKLEEAMDRAFSLDQVSRYSEEAKKNMESQIQGYQQMIALEEDKKKTDHEKIKEWEEAMEEVQEQYDELMEEGFNLVTSDILSDVMSTARGFVDAWHDAFMETGDGLSGLEQNFTDMFTELMRQQAAMSIVGQYVEQFKDQLKQFVDIEGEDTTLTTEEAREWAEKVKNTFPEISALLQSFFEGTQDLMQEQGELSELSKGIQGVTESTAQVLEALLNSMRFYVADSNMRLQNIEAAFASEEVSRNPILNELRQQTQMIRSIESMFDSVIGRGGSVHAGAYLKVSM